jgi:hypothetical protein
VRWADVETSWGALGSGEVRIVPLDGGGSRIDAQWTSCGATRGRDKVLLWRLHRGPMHRVIARLWRKTLDECAQPDGKVSVLHDRPGTTGGPGR